MLKSFPTPSFLVQNRGKSQQLELDRSFQELGLDLESQLASASSKAGEEEEKLGFNWVQRAKASAEAQLAKASSKARV